MTFIPGSVLVTFLIKILIILLITMIPTTQRERREKLVASDHKLWSSQLSFRGFFFQKQESRLLSRGFLLIKQPSFLSRMPVLEEGERESVWVDTWTWVAASSQALNNISTSFQANSLPFSLDLRHQKKHPLDHNVSLKNAVIVTVSQNNELETWFGPDRESCWRRWRLD